MEPDQQIQLDSWPYFRIYESCRIERFAAIEEVPPSFDATTGVTSSDKVIIPEIGVSARFYIPKIPKESPKKLPVLIHYHGGGFCYASKSVSPLHNCLNSLAAKANTVIVSVDYRLAPEHPVPIAYEDSWHALQWVLSGQESQLAERADFARVYLSGESAGANIAHRLAMMAGTNPLVRGIRIRGVILIHPYFLEAHETESNTFDPKASLDSRKLWSIVCPSTTGLDDYRINPMADGAPSLKNIGCDRVLVTIAGLDTLRDRGRAYCERLRGSGWGGELEVFEAPGEGHVFHTFRPTSELALAQEEKICGFINA